MKSSSRATDRVGVTFDEPTLVADAGLIVPATLMVRLGLEALVNQTVRLVWPGRRTRPGRKVLTLGGGDPGRGDHIDHADRLRAGATGRVLPFRVMAPSTLGTFLRSFTFGHVRQLDAVIAETIRRAWSLGAGPGATPMTIDLDSTIVEVHGKHKQGAAYGYTKVLGYHPLLATRAATGEVLHARLRKGSSQRGTKRFVEELIARVRRAGATGAARPAGRLGVLQLGPDRHPRPALGGLVDHRASERQRAGEPSPPSPRMPGSTSPTPTAVPPRWPRPST